MDKDDDHLVVELKRFFHDPKVLAELLRQAGTPWQLLDLLKELQKMAEQRARRRDLKEWLFLFMKRTAIAFGLALTLWQIIMIIPQIIGYFAP